MKWFRVFNFETVVGVIVISATASLAHAASTTTPSPDVTNLLNGLSGAQNMVGYQNFYDKKCEGKTGDDRDQRCDNLEDLLFGGSSSGTNDICQTALPDFKKDYDDFIDSCKETGISSGSCAKELSKCQGTNSEKHHRGGRSGGSDGPLDANNVRKQCPAMAAADEDKFEKQLKEQQDKVDKLKKELPELEDKKDKFVSEKNDKINDINDQMAKDAAEHSKELASIGKSRDQATKGISDQIAALQAEISKSKDQISQASLTKLKGQLDMKQAKVQADLNCHAQATAQVQKLQDQAVAQIQAGTYIRGDFSHFMRNVGVSDRAQWQRLALKYYNWCRASQPTIDSKLAADDAYNLVVQQGNAAVNSVQDHISQVESQIANLSCQPMPGQTGESQCQQALRQAQQDMAQSESDYRTKRDAATQKIQSMATQAEQQRQRMEKEIADKGRELNDENHRLDEIQDYLDAKYARGGTTNVDGKAVQGALAKMDRLQSDALAVLTCTGQKAAKSSRYRDGDDFCKPDATCSAANRFLTETQYKVTHPDDVELDTTVHKATPLVLTPAAPTVQPRAPADDGSNTQGQREGNSN